MRGRLLIDFNICVVLYPLMLKGLLGSGPLFGVKHQETRNEVLCQVADSLPNWGIETVCSFLNIVQDLFIRCSIKGWDPRHHNISDHTYRPQIALFTVVPIQYLWCYIVWCANHLFEVLANLEGLCRPKIDKLYLIELLGRFQQHVLWLQVPVDYIVHVTV